MRELLKKLQTANPSGTKTNTLGSPDPRFGFRIRFKPESLITDEQALFELLTNNGVTNLQPAKASGSPTYDGRGYKGEYNNEDVYFLLNSVAKDSGTYPRKTFSPEKLGLHGRDFQTHEELLTQVKQGINDLAIVSDEHKAVMLELVMSCEDDREFILHPILETPVELSKIESDLGESLAALYCTRQGKCVEFPSTINNALIDFYEDYFPASVKSSKGGSVNLSRFAPLIPNSTPVERVFWACGNHDKEELFKAGSESSSIIKDLADLVGGTTEAAVAAYIKRTDYDTFYKWVDEHPRNLNHWGVPEGEKAARDYWVNGDSHNRCPFYFTLCTLLQQVWAVDNSTEVSSVLAGILTGCKFYDVKIDLNKKRVIIAEQKFSNVNNWSFLYWSRATAAFHNWPGAVRKKNNDSTKNSR